MRRPSRSKGYKLSKIVFPHCEIPCPSVSVTPASVQHCVDQCSILGTFNGKLRKAAVPNTSAITPFFQGSEGRSTFKCLTRALKKALERSLFVWLASSCWPRARRLWRIRPAALRWPCPLERRNAGVPASKLRCNVGKTHRAFAILVSTLAACSTRHRKEQRGQPALPRRAASGLPW